MCVCCSDTDAGFSPVPTLGVVAWKKNGDVSKQEQVTNDTEILEGWKKDGG